MTLNDQLEITTNNFPSPRYPQEGPPSARRPHSWFRVGRQWVRAVAASAFVLVLRQPILAQVPVVDTHATVVAGAQPKDLPEAPRPASDTGTAANPGGNPVHSATATITGTVLDVNGDLVPGATVLLKDSSSDDRQQVTADDSAAFKFDSVKAGVPYEITVEVKGFSTWTSPS